MVIGLDRALITDVIISNGSTQKKENKPLEYCRHIVLAQNFSFSCKLHSIPLALSSLLIQCLMIQGTTLTEKQKDIVTLIVGILFFWLNIPERKRLAERRKELHLF